MAVSGQISDHDRIASRSGVVSNRLLESPVTFAKQHSRYPLEVSRDQIRMAVAIHVPDGCGKGNIPARAVGDWSLESAVAVAEQYAHQMRLPVRDHQIRMAVAVHVPDHDRNGKRPTRAVSHRGLEGAVTLAQEHAQSTIGEAAIVGHNDVRWA